MGGTCSMVDSDNLYTNPDRMKSEPTSESDSGTKRLSFYLTDAQIKTILETWQLVDNKHEFTKRVFLRIFSIKPSLKVLFNFDPCISEELLQETPKFSSHAANFASFLHMIVGHLNGNEMVAMKVCKVIGREHVRFTKDREFDSKYWSTFIEAVLTEIEEEMRKLKIKPQYSSIVIEAWSRLLVKVVEFMECAYSETFNKINKEYVENTSI